MKILLYSGMQKMIEKSGVGRAIYHQERALAMNGYHSIRNKKEKHDIVHINTVFPSSMLLAMKSRRRGIPVVYHAHSTKEDFCNSYICSNFFAPFFKWWIKTCYRRGDVIITPTEYSKKIIQSYGIKKPIIAISNGIDTDNYINRPEDRKAFRETYGYSEEDKVIMSAGLWIERKGILDFVELAKRMPDFQFIWFGYSNLKTVPRKIRKALKKPIPNLKFPGYVKKEELIKAYSGSDLFLFLSKEETEGIVILESLAMEIPVLIRDIPVYSDWLQDGKDLYKGASVEEIQDKIRKIISGDLPRLTDEGRKTVLKKDIKTIGKQLVKVYLDLYNKADLSEKLSLDTTNNM